MTTATAEPTLNGILSTVTTADFEVWKLQIENKKAAVERMAERRRRELTPIERVALPELERVNDTPPYIEIGGVQMARIDWNFVNRQRRRSAASMCQRSLSTRSTEGRTSAALCSTRTAVLLTCLWTGILDGHGLRNTQMMS